MTTAPYYALLAAAPVLFVAATGYPLPARWRRCRAPVAAHNTKRTGGRRGEACQVCLEREPQVRWGAITQREARNVLI